MKKYLLITQRCPYPPHKNGGVHTIYNIIKNVPSDVELDVFYYYERDLEAEQVIKRVVHKIEYKKLYKMPNKFTRMKNFISGIPDYYSEVDLKKIDVEIDYDKYDVVILDQIYSLPFAEYIPRDVSIISMMHDNNAMLYERKANAEKLFVKKFYDRKQSEYFKKVEEKYFNKIKKVIYVSDLDATRSQSEHKNCTCKFDNIILGVDLPENNQFSNAKENSIVFSGVMDYGPNEDAAYYFATEVYPAIKEKINDAEFVIAGKNPTQKLVDLKCKNIHITGFVDDMYRTISSSEIYVSPLRYHWQRRFRKQAYEEMKGNSSVPAVTEKTELSFVEIPCHTSAETNTYMVSDKPVATIRTATLQIDISNEISDALLSRIIQEVSHA